MQMAAGLMNLRAAGKVHVRSAGSDPAEEINRPSSRRWASSASTGRSSQSLTDEVVRAADAVITMGCGMPVPSIRASATSTGAWRSAALISKQSGKSATRSMARAALLLGLVLDEG